MGVLDAAGGRGAEPEDQTPAPEPEPAPGDQGDARARAEDGTFVSAEKLKPEAPPSRRSRARDEVENTIKSHLTQYEQRAATERAQYEQRLSAADQRWQQQQENLARMQGALEEMRSRPAQQAAPVVQGPEPDELRRQATQNLAEGKLDEYHRLWAQATRIDAKREAEGIFKPQLDAFKAEMEKRIPPQVDPQIQYLINTHPNVAKNGPRGIQAVMIKENELVHVYGHQPGPATRQKAFELADKVLGGLSQQNGRPAGFDQSAALALSSAPSARGAGGGGGGGAAGGVQLSKEDTENARKAGFNAADWVKWGDPHKYGLAK